MDVQGQAERHGGLIVVLFIIAGDPKPVYA